MLAAPRSGEPAWAGLPGAGLGGLPFAGVGSGLIGFLLLGRLFARDTLALVLALDVALLFVMRSQS
jgi:hypothetical protein